MSRARAAARKIRWEQWCGQLSERAHALLGDVGAVGRDSCILPYVIVQIARITADFPCTDIVTYLAKAISCSWHVPCSFQRPKRSDGPQILAGLCHKRTKLIKPPRLPDTSPEPG